MRKHLKISQAEFGATGGVSQSTQNRYEQTDADIPISYLDKIFEKYGTGFNENWFYFGKGQMLTTDDVLHRIDDFTELSRQESQIIAEVTQFSNFLRHRPLRPEVKRRLLELLIESIDQALTKLAADRAPVE